MRKTGMVEELAEELVTQFPNDAEALIKSIEEYEKKTKTTKTG